MFKNTLITLLLGAASICSAMELAQKHLEEMQKLREAGMADNLQVLEAELAYLEAEHFLNADTMTDAESQKSLDKMLELMRQAHTLAKARYQMGLCSYRKVLDAEYALRCEEAALHHNSPAEILDELKKIQQEYNSCMEQRLQAGMLDAVEQLEWQRTLLMKQLFDNTLPATEAATIQKEIEQNFSVAKKLIQRRYNEGLAPYDEIEHINNLEMQFQLNLDMWNMAMRNINTREQWQEAHRKHANALKQAYEAVADSPGVSPLTKLQRRIDYLVAERTAKMMASEQ